MARLFGGGVRDTAIASASFAMLFLLNAASAEPAYAQAPGGTAQQPAPADSAAASDQVIDAGRKIFHGQGTCHACHGEELQGGPIAPSLRGAKWRHIDGSFEEILHTVRGGSPGTLMVARPGGIDDAQAIQVATYVWAVSHGKAKP